ncbi:MAG TPA: Gfo/Idh/MocA family oxidoreductase [Vicinamibacterales bacterium]|nr:Gfo/Idh/MocA family oxidoreductase [Vicinamibacterales bacterium]
MTAGVGIVGCGLIGRKRAAALAGARLVACADTAVDRAQALASAYGGDASSRWEDVVSRPDVDVVIVATTNDALMRVATAAIRENKHVLLEKPAGRSVAELDILIAAAAQSKSRVRTGFNHRYHPALLRARSIVEARGVGDLMFLRARYGHGGRVGYDREWRADPSKGGGELIDQGVHLIDLSRWFLGEFSEISGFAHTYFWDMPVDDNAFMLLRTVTAQAAHLHVSCSEWKNLFSMEIYGRTGKLQIDGLGGSYGTERLTFYKMRPEMGPPDTETWEFPGADDSWTREFAEFLEDIQLGRSPQPGLADARAALTVVEAVHRQSGYDFSAAHAVSS